MLSFKKYFLYIIHELDREPSKCSAALTSFFSPDLDPLCDELERLAVGWDLIPAARVQAPESAGKAEEWRLLWQQSNADGFDSTCGCNVRLSTYF